MLASFTTATRTNCSRYYSGCHPISQAINKITFCRLLSTEENNIHPEDVTDTTHHNHTKKRNKNVPKGKYRIHIIAAGKDTYGPREYHLIPHHLVIERHKASINAHDSKKMIMEEKVASLYASKNVLIGAWCRPPFSLIDTCSPLVERARRDAERNGEQVQAMASLYGLCDWVADCIRRGGQGSAVLSQIIKEREDDSEQRLQLEAVKSIATQSPDPEPNSMVDERLYRDAQPVWEALVREYCDHVLAEEVDLYKSKGAVLVDVLHLAEKSDQYLKSAGGAMVRMFFL